MRARQVRASDVRVGDWIRTPYHPAMWQMVTECEVVADAFRPVRLDTDLDRTWWTMDERVSCKALARG